MKDFTDGDDVRRTTVATDPRAQHSLAQRTYDLGHDVDAVAIENSQDRIVVVEGCTSHPVVERGLEFFQGRGRVCPPRDRAPAVDVAHGQKTVHVEEKVDPCPFPRRHQCRHVTHQLRRNCCLNCCGCLCPLKGSLAGGDSWVSCDGAAVHVQHDGYHGMPLTVLWRELD